MQTLEEIYKNLMILSRSGEPLRREIRESIAWSMHIIEELQARGETISRGDAERVD